MRQSGGFLKVIDSDGLPQAVITHFFFSFDYLVLRHGQKRNWDKELETVRT